MVRLQPARLYLYALIVVTIFSFPQHVRRLSRLQLQFVPLSGSVLTDGLDLGAVPLLVDALPRHLAAHGEEGENQFSLEKMESTLCELKNIFKEKERLVEDL